MGSTWKVLKLLSKHGEWRADCSVFICKR